MVALNFYPPSSDARADFWDATTDGWVLQANALNFTCTTPRPGTAADHDDAPAGADAGGNADLAPRFTG